MDVEHHEDLSRRRLQWLWWAFAAAALFYLLAEHRAHAQGLIGLLPWLILAACPLMHVLGHGGHGGHRGHDGHGRGDPRDGGVRRAPPGSSPSPSARAVAAPSDAPPGDRP